VVATPRPAPAVTPRPVVERPAETPRPQPQPQAQPETRSVQVTPFPRVFATPVPATPLPAVTPAPAPAPITIQKSGLEEERGLEPAKGGGGWFSKWKYLPKGVRDAIDRAPVQKRRWRYIVIHNSGTRQGNAKAFEYYHRRVRKMQNGLAYHFVVGNGTSSGNGQVEIGNRWTRQINGGHVHSDYLNNIALGICLVGDFNRQTPTSRQLLATEELVRYLRRRVGKIDRQDAILKAHRDINPPRWPTDCPGDRFTRAMVNSLDK
jgi:hypothetical protein